MDGGVQNRLYPSCQRRRARVIVRSEVATVSRQRENWKTYKYQLLGKI